MSGRALLIIAVLIFAAIASQGGGGIVPIGPSGPKTVVIAYETQQATPELSMLATVLRNEPYSTAIKTAGHSLFVLDKDVVDDNGKLLEVLEMAKPITVPELIVYDLPPTKIIKRMPCPMSPAAVMEAIK